VVLITVRTGGSDFGIIVDPGAPIAWTTASSLRLDAAGAISINSMISNTTDPAAVLKLIADPGVSQDVTNGGYFRRGTWRSARRVRSIL
jgi:hypothetical protein